MDTAFAAGRHHAQQRLDHVLHTQAIVIHAYMNSQLLGSG